MAFLTKFTRPTLLQAHSLIKHGNIFLVAGDFNMPIVIHDSWSGLRMKMASISCYLSSLDLTRRQTMLGMWLNCGLLQLTNLENDSHNVLDFVFTNMPELTLVSIADLKLIFDEQDEAHVLLHWIVECEPSFCPPPPSFEKIYCFKKAPFNLIPINNFSEWCCKNGFELNEDKRKIMTISRKRSPILADLGQWRQTKYET